MTGKFRTYKLVEIPISSSAKQEIASAALSCGMNHDKFIIGELYKIVTKAIDKTYKCVAYIDVPEENPEERLDVVVMKQVAGPISMIWPLSEDDCEFLHINYEKGLLVFPASYNFKKLG